MYKKLHLARTIFPKKSPATLQFAKLAQRTATKLKKLKTI